MQQLPIENIKKLSYVDGVITIVYDDGNKLMTRGNIELVKGYVNTRDYPLNDHCV